MAKKKSTVTLKKALALKYSNLSICLLRSFVKPLVNRFLRIDADLSQVKHLSGVYILLPNHTTVLDPIIYHKLRPWQIHFVVSDSHFRNLKMRLFLSLSGSIAKKKNQKDNQAIKDMLYILHVKKEPLCIFPEGVNTWDGTSHPPIAGTAGLIKFAKVPVIIGKTHGAYLTRPRWGHQIRRGKINVKFTQLFTTQEIESLTKSEIHNKLQDALAHNEFDKQRIYPITFVSPTRAEYVERVLFVCPHCLQTQTIHSYRQYFACSSCKYQWFMDQQGFFHDYTSIFAFPLRAKTFFPHNDEYSISNISKDIASWNKWQKKFMEQHLQRFKKNEIIFYDENCILQYGVRRLCISLGVGRITLTNTHIYFFPQDVRQPAVNFPLSKLMGLNVQNNEKLEWTIGKIVYQVLPNNLKINTYKYMVAINELNRHMTVNNS